MEYSYGAFGEDIYQIINQIKKSEYIPDLVIGIIRGGLVPAVCLSHKFNAKLFPLLWQTRDGNQRDMQGLYEAITSKPEQNILIVDDIVDSGITMREINNTIEMFPLAPKQLIPLIGRIKYCSLVYNKTQREFNVDYYGRTIDRDITNEWVNFWWEKQR